jgi:hypothetical protein
MGTLDKYIRVDGTDHLILVPGNYHAWKRQMAGYLDGKGIGWIIGEGHMKTTEKKWLADAAGYPAVYSDEWIDANRKVNSLIDATVTANYQTQIINLKNAAHKWSFLASVCNGTDISAKHPPQVLAALIRDVPIYNRSREPAVLAEFIIKVAKALQTCFEDKSEADRIAFVLTKCSSATRKWIDSLVPPPSTAAGLIVAIRKEHEVKNDEVNEPMYLKFPPVPIKGHKATAWRPPVDISSPSNHQYVYKTSSSIAMPVQPQEPSSANEMSLFVKVALAVFIPTILGGLAYAIYQLTLPPYTFVPAAQFAPFCIIGQFCKVCFICQVSYISIISQASVASVFSMSSAISFSSMFAFVTFYSWFSAITVKGYHDGKWHYSFFEARTDYFTQVYFQVFWFLNFGWGMFRELHCCWPSLIIFKYFGF